jgi:hypothetical protein
MKVTKTEQAILKDLQSRLQVGDDGITATAEACFEAFSGRGREGGRVSEGWRKLDAASRLVARGVCRCVKREVFVREGVSYSVVKIALDEPA